MGNLRLPGCRRFSSDSLAEAALADEVLARAEDGMELGDDEPSRSLPFHGKDSPSF